MLLAAALLAAARDCASHRTLARYSHSGQSAAREVWEGTRRHGCHTTWTNWPKVHLPTPLPALPTGTDTRSVRRHVMVRRARKELAVGERPRVLLLLLRSEIIGIEDNLALLLCRRLRSRSTLAARGSRCCCCAARSRARLASELWYCISREKLPREVLPFEWRVLPSLPSGSGRILS